MEITVKAKVKRDAFKVGGQTFEEQELDRIFVVTNEETAEEEVKASIEKHRAENHQSKFTYLGPCEVIERKNVSLKEAKNG